MTNLWIEVKDQLPTRGKWVKVSDHGDIYEAKRTWILGDQWKTRSGLKTFICFGQKWGYLENDKSFET